MRFSIHLVPENHHIRGVDHNCLHRRHNARYSHTEAKYIKTLHENPLFTCRLEYLAPAFDREEHLHNFKRKRKKEEKFRYPVQPKKFECLPERLSTRASVCSLRRVVKYITYNHNYK